MKLKLTLFTMLVMIASISFAQLNIITNEREDGVWNDTAKKWEILKTEKSLSYVMFDINLTEFTMYYKDATSEKFKIIDYEYDKETFEIDMVVKNSKGKDYDVKIDENTGLFILFYYDAKDNFNMHRYYTLQFCFNNN